MLSCDEAAYAVLVVRDRFVVLRDGHCTGIVSIGRGGRHHVLWLIGYWSFTSAAFLQLRMSGTPRCARTGP